MNNYLIVNKMDRNSKENLITSAIAMLPTHIKANVVMDSIHKSGPFCDAEIELTSGRKNVHFYVEAKRIHRKESLKPLFEHAGPNTLLICNGLSEFLLEQCQRHNLNVIDTFGNISIQADNLMIWVQRTKVIESAPQPTDINRNSLMSEGVSKLLFILAAEPNSIKSTYRELAEMANISLGMVSKALKLLQEERVVSIKPKRVLDEERLIQLWLDSYRVALRKSLGGIRVKYPESWSEISLEQDDKWGGEVAAEQLTAYLYAHDWQLFTHLPLQKKLAQLKCRPDAEGNLWLVPAFWGKSLKWSDRTQALLAIAELEASLDSRNHETARMLHEQYLSTKETN
ncbi:hypothetical protein MAQ5080_01258 [Marinomonas aquimarina]|uniref:Uncharacterized protein n=2 Tax=Marinomonas aquimarina TaxID=295068 RepID=A0A1A8T8J9_9GAMM|nr:type IV toxin-antitoxin system AbiEi family antitoxin [Marinomonas aquimarina]SBS29007.1 hypothetical protein MAQ5080_01258 [Marinomonas aquimarina]